MSCKRHARDWPLWAAGDLSGRRLARFEAHLEVCPRCAGLARAMQATNRLAADALAAGPADPPDGADWTRMLARAAEARPARGWAWPALAAAAAAVLLVLLLWLPGHAPRSMADAGEPDGGRALPGPAPREVALVDAAERADRYEMRLATSDPKVKIVWVFDRNLSI